MDGEYLQGNNDLWYCISCSSSIFPINCLNNKNFGSLLISQTSQTKKCSYDNNNSSLRLHPSTRLTSLVNQFNNNTHDDNDKDAENFIHSKYLILMRFRNWKFCTKKKCLSLFYINACSLGKNCDELQHL